MNSFCESFVVRHIIRFCRSTRNNRCYNFPELNEDFLVKNSLRELQIEELCQNINFLKI